jgi:hypothetical protein
MNGMQIFREDDGRIALIRVILVSRNTSCHEKDIFRSGNFIFCDRSICTDISKKSSAGEPDQSDRDGCSNTKIQLAADFRPEKPDANSV